MELFLETCAAAAYLHDAGRIHLDIKPDNVLVDGDGCVCLTDFGLARPVIGWTASRVAGTPAFMAPEHLAGDVPETEGRVRGTKQTPYEDMMPKPGVEYAPKLPEGEVPPSVDPSLAMASFSPAIASSVSPSHSM